VAASTTTATVVTATSTASYDKNVCEASTTSVNRQRP
jgi:hypothetical protein